MYSHHYNTWAGRAFLGMLALTGATATAMAQSRERVRLARPGQLVTEVTNSPISTFRAYSYGVGATQTGTPTSVLRSRIAGQGAARFDLQRTGGPSPTGRVTDMLARPTAAPVDYSIDVPGLRLPPASGRLINVSTPESPTAVRTNAVPYVTAGEYFQQLAGEAGTPLDDPTSAEPITSLAPDGDSPYAKHLRAGEAHFRKGDYLKALEEFQLANVGRSAEPESLLSLAHTHFALSKLSYSQAAFYLAGVLEVLPELPAAQLKPATFFANQTEYDRLTKQLASHVEDNPSDAEAKLMLAYFRWFEGEREKARALLVAAKKSADRARLAEAADQFLSAISSLGSESAPSAGPAATSS